MTNRSAAERADDSPVSPDGSGTLLGVGAPKTEVRHPAPAARVLALALLPAIVAALASGCGGHPRPFAALTERHAFTDDIAMEIRISVEGLDPKVVVIEDASHYKVVESTVGPGQALPWHTHPGSVLVAMTRGELVYVDAENCVHRSYPTGTAFVDAGFGHVHMAFNPSEDSETVVIATYLGVPAEGPLTQPVNEVRNAELDARCGIAR